VKEIIDRMNSIWNGRATTTIDMKIKQEKRLETKLMQEES